MPLKFSIVMTVYEPLEFLPRAFACLQQQEYEDWELICVMDGPLPSGRFDPRRMIRQLRQNQLVNRIELLELPRAEGCWGNVGRRLGLDHAQGDYVCWVNHDNLITPQYLSTHVGNVAERPGCVSVVDISHWTHDRYHGRLPKAFRRSKIDLLCFALPLPLARAIDAFGPAMQTVYAADWLVFEAATARAPIQHTPRIVGTHF